MVNLSSGYEQKYMFPLYHPFKRSAFSLLLHFRTQTIEEFVEFGVKKTQTSTSALKIFKGFEEVGMKNNYSHPPHSIETSKEVEE